MYQIIKNQGLPILQKERLPMEDHNLCIVLPEESNLKLIKSLDSLNMQESKGTAL